MKLKLLFILVPLVLIVLVNIGIGGVSEPHGLTPDQNDSKELKTHIESDVTEARQAGKYTTVIETKTNKAKDETVFDGCTELVHELDGELKAFDENFRRVLSLNSTLESRFVSSLLHETSIQTKTSELMKINDSNSDPLLSYDVLAYCTHQNVDCSGHNLDEVYGLDTQNAAVATLLALNLLKAGNVNDANKFILVAANSPTYNDYWGEHFGTLELALEQSGLNNPAHLMRAIETYQTQIPVPQYKLLVDHCSKKDLDVVIEASCQRLGSKLENSNGTMLSTLVGINIQKKIAQNNDDSEYVEELEKKVISILESSADIQDKQGVVTSNAENVQLWFDALKNDGEIAAQRVVNNSLINVDMDSTKPTCDL